MKVSEVISEAWQGHKKCWNGTKKDGFKVDKGMRVPNCIRSEKRWSTSYKEAVSVGADGELVFEVGVSEDLRKWFKEKWVRFGPDGKIRGDCARGSSKEGKPKCLPKKKAQALGKKGRKSAASRKRRQDPNKNRKGKAKNVATKKK